MKTVSQVIEHYNKQQSIVFNYIVVSNPRKMRSATLTYYDVSDVIQTNDMLSFYGKSVYESRIGGTARFVRINDAKVIRSEV